MSYLIDIPFADNSWHTDNSCYMGKYPNRAAIGADEFKSTGLLTVYPQPCFDQVDQLLSCSSRKGGRGGEMFCGSFETGSCQPTTHTLHLGGVTNTNTTFCYLFINNSARYSHHEPHTRTRRLELRLRAFLLHPGRMWSHRSVGLGRAVWIGCAVCVRMV